MKKTGDGNVKKKLGYVLTMCVLSLVLIFSGPMNAKADFGDFSGSSDYGGGWDSGGSDWSSDW